MRMVAWVVLGGTAGVTAACATYAACLDSARAIVANMTVQAMAAQMTQLDIGQVLNSDLTLNEAQVEAYAKLGIGSYLNSPFAGGPKNAKYGWNATEWRDILGRIQAIHRKIDRHPILFGLDSVHGANYVANAVLFPHQINAGASFNRRLVKELGFYTARDTAAAGIPWIFGPILDVTSHKAWPRVYETFGEDPFLVTQMASQIVHGLQDNHTIAACFKHFIGYAATPSGHDRDPITLSDYEILNYYMPPFQAAIDAGALSGMMNYVSLNGVPMGANRKMLINLLRGDLAFKGMLVTDWGVIDDLATFHHVAATEEDAVAMALTETSIDMSMDATHTRFIDHALALVEAKTIEKARLAVAAERIIALKLHLDLYATPLPGADSVPRVGDAESIQAARTMARESIVLLQNRGNVLPLPSSASSLLLTGPSLDNIGHLCGGWSLAWQGMSGNAMFPHGRSVLSAFQARFGNVTALETMDVKTAIVAEFTVVVLGEGPYAEKPGDIDDLSLPLDQLAYVRSLATTPTKLILVLLQGRPRLLHDLPQLVHAIVYAGLPCEMGGDALVDVLLGVVNPSGRLPITYPRSPSDASVVHYHPQDQGCHVGYHFEECDPQWPFGAGLSYTRFQYRGAHAALLNDALQLTVTVANVGAMTGDEVVLVFLREHARSRHVPEAKRLIFFDKVHLAAGASTTVRATLSLQTLGSYFGPVGETPTKSPLEGVFTVQFTIASCDVDPTLCVTLTTTTKKKKALVFEEHDAMLA
ncbi:hypothetical protein SPRG_11332 [Saprolegnia parasitica CBS 223.65]|uniref:beta-glucosidase n=1 Tax=Saprolegnia parasitica (strain CBS 223.65) TaxID=695850 RepID=A0A067BZU7_SAPPC|nr:hypothetical protein SPRG_11332 [Saprolegnia parasitica CBS 223.65]KDO22380.1 hypothetical protein SPRG_11332 [Saprolegnia parasitica CBS 223.65]|eukprot:XP_012206904.1 hypothetical protein SPRG_11332 [Saprolegnia parasitica CBS 223.65]